MRELASVKIFVRHPTGSESLWAEDLGTGSYRLMNSPFLVYDLSNCDVVIATRAEDGNLWFDSVEKRGGHSTYRIMLAGNQSAKQFRLANWPKFYQLGCSFEQAGERLFAVDVPPSANVQLVYDELAAGEAQGLWEFEEGHLGQPG